MTDLSRRDMVAATVALCLGASGTATAAPRAFDLVDGRWSKLVRNWASPGRRP